MNFEIHEFCHSKVQKKSKQKPNSEERKQQVIDIITRSEKPSPENLLALLERNKDPLDFIPNYHSSLEKTLKTIPNRTNKVLLQFSWQAIPFFRDHHNLLLTDFPTFIRRNKDPEGLIVHMHCEKNEETRIIFGFCLADNPSIQDIRQITITLKK